MDYFEESLIKTNTSTKQKKPIQTQQLLTLFIFILHVIEGKGGRGEKESQHNLERELLHTEREDTHSQQAD